MSRIGKKPIEIPSGVKTKVDSNLIHIEGPKGKLQMEFDERFSIATKNNKIVITRPSELKKDLSLHGLIRSNIFNMVNNFLIFELINNF